MLLIVYFFNLTLYILTHLYFVYSLENDVMETSKRCVFSLIFFIILFHFIFIFYFLLNFLSNFP